MLSEFCYIFLSARHKMEDAISRGDTHAAQQLLSSYASRLTNTCHTHGALKSLTLAHHAMCRDKPAILSLLLKAGAKPEEVNKRSLLFDAVFTVRAECVQRLLEDGHADPNVIVVSQDPRTVHGSPLHCNSYNLGVPVQTLTNTQTFADKIKIAQALLDHGAIVTIKDGLGRTAIDILDLQPEQESANQLKKLFTPLYKAKNSMSNIHKHFYVFLLISTSFFGMEEPHTISDAHQRLIAQAETVSVGADVFNALVALHKIASSKGITPSLANTRWCIDTLATRGKARKLIVAQKLNPALSRDWLCEYLNTEQGFSDAIENLKLATQCDDKPLAAFLLSSHSFKLANARTEIRMRQRSFVDYCVEGDRPQILSLLLQAGADPGDQDQPNPVLMNAVVCLKLECIRLLLVEGYSEPNSMQIDPHLPNQSGNTALHYNSLNLEAINDSLLVSRITIARHLIDHGADRTLKNAKGKTPIDLADPNNRGGNKGQLKQFLQTYNPKKKIA